MKFKGTIIITDPCYFMRAKHHGTTGITKDDWKTCEYGLALHKLGIKNYISTETGVGDWCCDVINTNSSEIIGEFCADSGMVCVALLSEVLKYNPEFDYHINNKWTCTTIEDFDGDISIRPDDDGVAMIKGIGSVNFENTFTGF